MPKRKRTDYIVIHCSATPPTMDIGAETIRGWHRARGWGDIGYHYVLRRNGVAEAGRPFDEVGAHAQGHNHNSVAICYVGGVDAQGNPEDNRTDNQKDGLRALVAMCRMLYPDAEVLGHRDLPGVAKACPSFDAKEEYA